MSHEFIKLEITIDGDYAILFLYICLQAKTWRYFRMKYLKLNLEFIFDRNPYLTAVIGDFNAKLHNWY